MNVALEIAKVVATAGGELGKNVFVRRLPATETKTAWRRLRLAAVNTTAVAEQY